MLRSFFLFLIRFIAVQLQIEEISRKLRTGDLGIASVEERFDKIYLKQQKQKKNTERKRDDMWCDRLTRVNDFLMKLIRSFKMKQL